MIMKAPSLDWSDHIEYMYEEDENLSDFDDEPDFSEYMWMENEEEFDKNELKRLEEEERMQECIDAMIEDELEAELEKLEKQKNENFNAALNSLAVSEINVENSLLNPLAAEFVPQSYTINLSLS